MRVVVVSYYFDVGAEGVCTGRLTRALLDQGVHVTLVTSDNGSTGFTHPNLQYFVVPRPNVPGRMNTALNLLAGTPEANLLWCRRVARLAPSLDGHDLVYGRSSPVSSIHAARLLAAKLRKPFWAHYSDPIPNPWAEPGSSLQRRQISYSRRLSLAAHTLTFTTSEGMNFQERTLNLRLSHKAFVLNHVAPRFTSLDRPPQKDPIFAYLGLFYGQRNANALLHGFASLLKKVPAATFNFVGSDPKTVLPLAETLKVQGAVRVLPSVADVKSAMADANVLVGLDSSHGEPVFMTTKIVEYLMVNRVVLMITPPQSPSSKLLQGFPSSTVRTAEDPDKICEAMLTAWKAAQRTVNFEEREVGMAAFSPESVARKFLHEQALRLK